MLMMNCDGLRKPDRSKPIFLFCPCGNFRQRFINAVGTLNHDLMARWPGVSGHLFAFQTTGSFWTQSFHSEAQRRSTSKPWTDVREFAGHLDPLWLHLICGDGVEDWVIKDCVL